MFNFAAWQCIWFITTRCVIHKIKAIIKSVNVPLTKSTHTQIVKSFLSSLCADQVVVSQCFKPACPRELLGRDIVHIGQFVNIYSAKLNAHCVVQSKNFSYNLSNMPKVKTVLYLFHTLSPSVSLFLSLLLKDYSTIYVDFKFASEIHEF